VYWEPAKPLRPAPEDLLREVGTQLARILGGRSQSVVIRPLGGQLAGGRLHRRGVLHVNI
jgi:hypothetical protein